MSVIYRGREHKVTFKENFFTLNLSYRGIEDISEIEGLENLTTLQVLDLSNNDISKIRDLENLVYLKSLEKLYLGKNPVYKNFENFIAKKKKISRMTPEKREKAGINPKSWEMVVNSRFKLFKQPPRIDKKKLLNKKTHGDVPEGICCIIEFLTVFIFLISFAPKIGV